MKPRSRKYIEYRKNDNGSKKGSANLEGYNEETPSNYKNKKENPAPSENDDLMRSHLEATANTDDTGGSNNSGKRQDPH